MRRPRFSFPSASIIIVALALVPSSLSSQRIPSFCLREASHLGILRRRCTPVLRTRMRLSVTTPSVAAQPHSTTNRSAFPAATALHRASGTILLLATTEDKASVNMLHALLARGGWEEITPVDASSRVWHRPDGPQNVFMWQITQGFLRADWLDKAWLTAHPSQRIQEMIFLSRHAAASGRPSLTIHPIGNPGQPFAPQEEARGEHGGIPGRCVPPSPRMAPLFRQLHRAVQDAGLAGTFEVTLEATHHGPWHMHPTMFVEIGSKEEDWGREDAAHVWADVLDKNLGLSATEENGVSIPAAEEPKLVIVGAGGGHYTPKMNDLLRHREDVLVGHILASYCFTGSEEDWKRGIDEAIQATRRAYSLPSENEEEEDGGKEETRVCVYIDKKAFKSAPRQALVQYLESRGIQCAFKENDLN